MKPIRQGDVILFPVELLGKEKPSGEYKESETLTVAHGEATGHHHTIYPEGGSVRHIDIGGVMFLELDTDALFKHQEHDQHRLKPNVCYERIMEEEYDIFEKIARKVVD
jgi:hypothetical protein